MKYTEKKQLANQYNNTARERKIGIEVFETSSTFVEDQDSIKFGINWSAFGTMEIHGAEAFKEELEKAINFLQSIKR